MVSQFQMHKKLRNKSNMSNVHKHTNFTYANLNAKIIEQKESL